MGIIQLSFDDYKECSKCHALLPENDYPWRTKNKKRHGQCRICFKAHSDHWREINRDRLAEKEKAARERDQEKIKARRVAYDTAEHREVARKRASEWYANNYERARETRRQYTIKTYGEMREYNEKWRLANMERLRVTRRRHYWANHEASRARLRAEARIRRAKYPSVFQAHKARRRARKMNAGGSFTAKQFKDLCDYYENTCLCCGVTGRMSADHVIPLACGGSNDISNIQPLCRSCNCKKNAKTIDYRPVTVIELGE